MNGTVLLLATCVAVGLGVGLWWLWRSVCLSIFASVGIVALVAVALPWDQGERNLASRDRRSSALGNSSQEAADTAARNQVNLARLQAVRPVESSRDGYVGSEACRDCHRHNHSTWHDSYHRTMTQVASPENVLGNFDNVRLTSQGREYNLRRYGEVCWAEMHDPALPVSDQSQINVPIVMSTGSHHMQVYWYATGAGRVVGLLPMVHLVETGEWIPRSAAFLQPQHAGVPGEVAKWNYMCSECHSTHRRERPRPGTAILWDTQVAEFGISCEACHGPGQTHIEFHQDSNGASSTGSQPKHSLAEDPIVNPANLSHERSSQVCGQCHSVQSTTEDERIYREHGHHYRPGDDLNETHLIWERESEEMKEFLSRGSLRMDPEVALNQVYYRDGVVRVSGREYNGIKNSACYKQGTMSCLTCHQMHQDESDPRSRRQWANDQLKHSALGDDSCLNCHQREAYGVEHTHHPSGSSGASCYNCHMPHQTYGLLKAIRSHTIVSPDLKLDVPARRPNACNQCHLDKTLGWTAEHLQSWYGITPPELDQDQRQVAASLLWLLKGDAAERAMAAWVMGWSDAQQASGSGWQAPFLAPLLNDSYLAIRFIARRSLRSLPGFDDLEFDNLADEPERKRKIDEISKRWEGLPYDLPQNHGTVLIEDGQLQSRTVDRLLRQRDHTPTELAE